MNFLIIFNIYLTFVLFIAILFFIVKIKNRIKEDTKTKFLNDSITEHNKALTKVNDKLKIDNTLLEAEYNNNRIKLDDLKEQFKKAQEEKMDILEKQKNLSSQAFENYWDVLENSYKEKEKEFDKDIQILKENFIKEKTEIESDLDQIKKTRAAAIQASLREKEIQENKDDYRLDISEKAVKDIRLLKSIQDDLSNPSVVDKIIWSNYYQPLAKTKFPKIIKKETTCGIYKLMSLKTGLVYIGQSVDICDRWKQHCKNALGVGTTTSENKLYKAMREDGLYNFTFELIESCSQAQLNEKEKFYIDLYDSYNFGLNSTKGNK